MQQSFKIGIERLKLRLSVGIYTAEKKKRQDVFLSAELFFSDSEIHIDAMEKSVDYDALCDEIRRVASLRHYEIIENLALSVAQALRTKAGCERCSVRVDKPLAARKNRAAGIYVVVEV